MTQRSQREGDNTNVLAAQSFLLVVAVLLTLACADLLVPRDILESLPGALRIEAVAADAKDVDGGILYLGDSVVDFFVKGESDERSIARMLGDLTNIPTVDLSHPAYGQKMFYAQMKRLKREKVPLRYLIVPINLRSFSQDWENIPAWDFEETYLSEAYNLYLTQRAYRVLGEEQPVAAGRTARSTRASARTVFAGSYAYDMNLSRSLPYLAANTSLAKDAPFTTLYYLTPINWDSLRNHLSASDIESVEKNLARLRQVLTDSGVEWLDLSDLLQSESYFHSASNPDEHLDQAGRMKVAEELQRYLLSGGKPEKANPRSKERKAPENRR